MPDFSEQDYQDFVGENIYSFVPYFMEVDARDGKFQFSWVWPAFFFQFIWFYYRKMYLWGTEGCPFGECLIHPCNAVVSQVFIL